MSEYRRVSRADKHTKRRKNKRNLLFFTGLAVFFVIILFALIAFGNKDKETVTENNQEEANQKALDKNEEENTNEQENTETDNNDSTSEDETNEEANEIEDAEEVVVQQVDSTDPNVIEAYTGNWAPIGTVQQGTHTTNYNEGSDDRKEIKSAVSEVTGISDAEMIEHWVGNGGEQKVISTVSNKDASEFYHVYLSWIDVEGWQVTKVERIKEFQKKTGSD